MNFLFTLLRGSSRNKEGKGGVYLVWSEKGQCGGIEKARRALPARRRPSE